MANFNELFLRTTSTMARMAAKAQGDTHKFVVISVSFPIPLFFLFPGVLGKMRNPSLGGKL